MPPPPAPAAAAAPPKGRAAAAATAAAAAAGATTTTKSVDEVTGDDSCVCWTPDECTCGQQQCPFLPAGGPANLPEQVRVVFQAATLPDLTVSGAAVRQLTAPPLTRSMLRRYNKRLGTQLIEPLYQFAGEHYILEGARRVLEAGSDQYKFRLRNEDANLQPISNVVTLLDMVRSPSLPYARLFDMPLSTYFMWAYPDEKDMYRHTYDLAAYLLKKYQGTGKTFMIGLWEGDNWIRDPSKQGRGNPPVVSRFETLARMTQEKQRAVDAAKRDFASCREVFVYNYIEVNYVIDSVWDQSQLSAVNFVLPDSPPVDYVSYSAYEVLIGSSGEKDARLDNLTAALDYIAQRLPPKPEVPGPRVFMGEWSYPLLYKDGTVAYGPEAGRQRGLYAAAVSIAWGVQWAQYWQLYDNVRLLNHTATDAESRGYWLVTSDNEETPLWVSMKDYFAAVDEFLRRFWSCYGGWPSDYTFRVWAVKTLMRLIAWEEGSKNVPPEPAVRELADPYAGVPAPIISSSTQPSQYDWTVTYGPARIAGTAAGTSAAAAAAAEEDRGQNVLGENRTPRVPQRLSGGGGDRGRCPIALPMISPGSPGPAPPDGPSRPRLAVPGVKAPQPPPGSPPAAAAAAPPGSPGPASPAPAGSSGPASPAPPRSPAPPAPAGSAGPTSPVPPRPPQPAAAPEWRSVPPWPSDNKTCSGAEELTGSVELGSPSCPFDYPNITVEDVVSGKSKPYTYGGIDRIGCANCQQKGLWPRFCTWRRTELENWDKVNCNQRENFGRVSVQRNLNFSSAITQGWPASSGIAAAAAARAPGGRLAPGPVEITPCDVWRLIRGRTLWIIGDSEMKGLFLALKCFMLEFWDLKQYAVSWNSTTNAYLKSLPYDAEAKCIHMRDSTRICQLKVLWANVFVEKPGPGETRWSTPVMELLHDHLATPYDIFALNFGLWYNPDNPDRYRREMEALGRAYQRTKDRFPNVFFLETVKLHWPTPPGDQDGGAAGSFQGGVGSTLEQCTPTADVRYNTTDSSLWAAAGGGGAAPAQKASNGSQSGAPGAEAGIASAETGNGSVTRVAAEPVAPRRQLLQQHAQQQQQVGQRWWQQGRAADELTGQHSSLQMLAEMASRATAAADPAAAAVGAGGSGTTPGATSLPSSAAPAAELEVAEELRRLLQAMPAPPPSPASSWAPAATPYLSAAPPPPPAAAPAGTGDGEQDDEEEDDDEEDEEENDSQGAAGALRGAKAGGPADAAGAPGGVRNGGAPPSPSPPPPATPPAVAFPGPPPAPGAARPTSPLPVPAATAPKSDGVTTFPDFQPSPSPALPSPPSLGSSNASRNASSSNVSRNASSSNVSSNASSSSASSSSSSSASSNASSNVSADDAAANVLSGLWRNRIAREVLRDNYGVPWVPIYNATVPPYWGHRNQPQAPDCIHYCNPGVPANWISQLFLAISLNVKPQEGLVRDARCMWGSEQVYDVGEKEFEG